VEINEKTIGRRFTIEPHKGKSDTLPRQQSPYDSSARKPGAAHQKILSPDAINGIRLFPGNELIASRKFGSIRNHLISALEKQDLKFTITEHGVDPELFIRVLYHCPRGVFVQTVRNDEEVPPPKVVTEKHHLYTFDREAGQALIVRPRVDGDTALEDLESNGIFVTSWFDQAQGRVRLRVAATDVWEVLASEVATERQAKAPAPVVIREDSREFLQLFFQEAAAYLDAEEMDLLKDKVKARLQASVTNRRARAT
jgi:hypothetical protein